MKIAFTSCMNFKPGPDGYQHVWDRIAQEQPDYLFLLGDQIYMDYFPKLGEPSKWDAAKFADVMQGKYEAQWNVPNFKALRDALRQKQGNGGGVYGTWDDHDFAWNNAQGSDVSAPVKQQTRRLFTQYMQIEQLKNPAHLDPAVDGIYYSIPLMHQQQRIGKAIFLDTRWYSTAPGDSKPLLGQKQLDYLKQELADEQGYVLICAGMPIRATGNGWMRYRDDYARFRAIIQGRKSIFLTGDIHENAFLPPAGETKMFEVVSSGAFVTKYYLTGERENFGILEYTPGSTDIKLFDKRGLEMHNVIDNATFMHQEIR
ncbi:alkaline phosphatase D family protein [Variovorax sp. 375MFSha3.1]|uniref:alkaline phosphatase D family protein n=1 Tax=unclassified Variovorax TaxID=663243 RepID=UPI003AAAF5D7